MGRFLVRRILQFVPVFLATTFLVYAMVFALPGDPIRALGGERGMAPSVIAEMHDRFNLDDPLLVQYGKYMGLVPEDDGTFDGVLQGSLGESMTSRDVESELRRRIPVSVRLGLAAFTLQLVLGLVAGTLAGIGRGGFLDRLVLVSTVVVISVPVLVTGFLLQILFGVELRWFPVAGVRDGWMSYVLPATVLASASLAYVARLTRSSLAETMGSDYIRSAVAKGLPPRRVVGLHALRNSLIPVITYLGIGLGAMFGGAIIIETIFNLPGIGRLLYDSILTQDGTVVVGIVTLLVVAYLSANLVVDVLYAVVDPRIRVEE